MKVKGNLILEANNVSCEYSPEGVVIEGVNIRVSPGEIVGIVGPSGAGKSTLLKCLAGLLPLKTGFVKIEGEKLVNPRELLKPGHPEVAIVNQLFELDDFFTVRENIANQLHHLSAADREDFIEELIEVFELEEVAELKSKDISGGEKQRLSMATALAKEPRCLLLDEPFVHFDVHLSKKITAYLKQMVEIRQMGVVLVTHNGAEALAWSDRLLMIRIGKITRMYSPEAAYFKPKSLYEGRFFGELNSIYVDGKQILFRPIEYSIQPKEGAIRVLVEWKYTNFHGSYYANYFKLENNKEIVLYSDKKLNTTAAIYVSN